MAESHSSQLTVVLKVGSSSISSSQFPYLSNIAQLVENVCNLRRQGYRVVKFEPRFFIWKYPSAAFSLSRFSYHLGLFRSVVSGWVYLHVHRTSLQSKLLPLSGTSNWMSSTFIAVHAANQPRPADEDVRRSVFSAGPADRPSTAHARKYGD